eukprot:408507_1
MTTNIQDKVTIETCADDISKGESSADGNNEPTDHATGGGFTGSNEPTDPATGGGFVDSNEPTDPAAGGGFTDTNEPTDPAAGGGSWGLWQGFTSAVASSASAAMEVVSAKIDEIDQSLQEARVTGGTGVDARVSGETCVDGRSSDSRAPDRSDDMKNTDADPSDSEWLDTLNDFPAKTPSDGSTRSSKSEETCSKDAKPTDAVPPEDFSLFLSAVSQDLSDLASSSFRVTKEAATSAQSHLSTALHRGRDVASQSLTALEGVVGMMLPRVDIDTDDEDSEAAAKPSPFRRAFLSALEAAGHPVDLETLRALTQASARKLRERLDRLEDVRREEAEACLQQLEAILNVEYLESISETDIKSLRSLLPAENTPSGTDTETNSATAPGSQDSQRMPAD